MERPTCEPDAGGKERNASNSRCAFAGEPLCDTPLWETLPNETLDALLRISNVFVEWLLCIEGFVLVFGFLID
tara:strand:+ start:1367 stop:1585 length:219 start_codon:yes stop_codon:yes gene_type:complete